jgi:hypothetical protein
MHSNVLSSKFLTQSQEQRIQAILGEIPRFAPWGAQEWRSFAGYYWTTVVHGKIPETVLVRESDHAAVLQIPRYTNILFMNTDSIVFTFTHDSVPAVYVVNRSQIEHRFEPISLKEMEDSTYFPALDRRELVAEVPDIPELITGHYFLGIQHYVWVLNTKTGEFDHNPVTWFNNSSAEIGFESIELVRVDCKTRLLVGMGAHIPNFVMSIDGKTLLTFVRKYRDGELDPASVRLVEKWTERLLKQGQATIC